MKKILVFAFILFHVGFAFAESNGDSSFDGQGELGKGRFNRFNQGEKNQERRNPEERREKVEERFQKMEEVIKHHEQKITDAVTSGQITKEKGAALQEKLNLMREKGSSMKKKLDEIMEDRKELKALREELKVEFKALRDR